MNWTTFDGNCSVHSLVCRCSKIGQTETSTIKRGKKIEKKRKEIKATLHKHKTKRIITTTIPHCHYYSPSSLCGLSTASSEQCMKLHATKLIPFNGIDTYCIVVKHLCDWFLTPHVFTCDFYFCSYIQYAFVQFKSIDRYVKLDSIRCSWFMIHIICKNVDCGLSSEFIWTKGLFFFSIVALICFYWYAEWWGKK